MRYPGSEGYTHLYGKGDFIGDVRPSTGPWLMWTAQDLTGEHENKWGLAASVEVAWMEVNTLVKGWMSADAA